MHHQVNVSFQTKEYNKIPLTYIDKRNADSRNFRTINESLLF